MEYITKLPLSFYQRKNVLQIAKDLLGKVIVTRWNGIVTSARIVETEAYAGVTDKASHAYGARRTRRNEVMYGEGGFAYVYLCYGIHHLFNVITNKEEIPHAILIRAGEPIIGIEEMLRRTGKKNFDNSLTRGPGNFSKALGIYTYHSGTSLLGKSLFLADDGFRYKKKDIVTSPRIGVDYAGDNALLPYRFFIQGNPFVSGKPNQNLYFDKKL
ncbi:MAG TPA: DNA-3-methyladenine glycosylase [Chitinophagaceae bacterium]